MDGVGLIGTVVGTQKRIEIGEYLSYVRHTDTTSNDTKKIRKHIQSQEMRFGNGITNKNSGLRGIYQSIRCIWPLGEF